MSTSNSTAGTRQHNMTCVRYNAPDTPKGYIIVDEYPLNGQVLMIDKEDDFILWSSLWKALGSCEVNITRILELRPDLSRAIRIIKLGNNKIHGTWMPFEMVETLAMKIAWPIREHLIPFFG
ncbi:uncharacterized protein C8R40DRAFT_1062498 [Lentinula edodes]|uniref:uncharacterized protein n=1 Tax=Lentinula edodes TaxID=5353 RepID=UPI001E8EAA2C|nr:uncharacterized protein C8R40DRAFT_1062498 [Lentinula edodes]KAH7868264.1 hypothetical protein C8R40DRAFT_1062498 [Lentinula edodes]